VNPVLNVIALKELKPRWQKAADELIGSLLKLGTFDAVTSVAQPFPMAVFADAVGLGPHGRDNLLALGSLAFETVGPHTDRVRCALAEAGMLAEWVDRASSREMLAPGGFGRAIHAGVDRGQITEPQARLLVRSLLMAGVDTSASAISATLHAFATCPAQWQLLRRRPELTKTALDEVLRWDSVVHCFFRTTTCDAEVEGPRPFQFIPRSCCSSRPRIGIHVNGPRLSNSI